jgi:hypothetical protein
MGGEGTRPSLANRGRSGWKWSPPTDRTGIPIESATDRANRHDTALFAPTLEPLQHRGPLFDLETVHRDRVHDTAGVRWGDSLLIPSG